MGINIQGVIVGWFYAPVDVTHAFLYKDGVMADLNNLLPTGSGWVLNYANDINDNGRIVGIGTINGQSHGFVAALAYPGDFPLLTAMWTEATGGADYQSGTAQPRDLRRKLRQKYVPVMYKILPCPPLQKEESFPLL